MEKAVQILINSVREEIGEFLGEINGPKEEKARDKMITNLLGAVNDAELDLGLYRPAPTGPISQKVVASDHDPHMVIDEKGRIWRDDVDTEVDAHHKALGKYYNDKLKKYEEDMSSANDLDSATMLTSAEITAEAEANYGQLHN
tara:strand:- start:218 stop:649 length:432 start_codon:yes stop_codon:yes gene_type:complete